jgi:hypothetical protein
LQDRVHLAQKLVLVIALQRKAPCLCILAQQRQQRICSCLLQEEDHLIGQVHKQGEVHVIAHSAQLRLQALQESLSVLGCDGGGIFCSLVKAPDAVCM